MKIIESNRMKELTMSQLAIWVASMLEENNTIYNLGEAIEILGPIDVDYFMQSLDHVAATTDVLHLQFIDTPEGPRQYIDYSQKWKNIYLDFKDKPDPKQSAFEWIQHHIETPIDLTCDPLFKMVLFELGEDHFFCYYFVHHICNDGFAASIVMKKVSDDYSARISGQQPLQTEMAPWENLFEYEQQYIDSKSHRQDRAYWLQELVDYPQPATISGRSPGRPSGSVESVRVLSRTKIAHIQQQMNDYGISFPQLLITLAAFYMHQLTSEDDLLLGIPVTARMGKKIRETVGMLANILPMRLQISHDETLLSLAQQVKGKMRQLLRHQRYHREELREALGLDPDQPELYGMVVNINSFAYDLNFGNSQCHVHNVGTRPVNDLQLVIFDHMGDEDLQFKLFGKTGHYSAIEINSLLDRFLTLLTSIDHDTLAQPLTTLTLVTDDAYAQAVQQYNQTDHPVTSTHLGALFEQQVRQNNQAIALVGRFLGEHHVSELSYQALDQLSNQMAHCLSQHGVEPGMRVGVCLERSIDLVVALLGILKLGAAYVPMATDLPTSRIEFICRDTEATLLVTHAVVAESLNEVRCFAFEARQLDRWPAHSLDIHVDADFLAYIIFTSGSTGQPKGVAVRHQPAVNLVEWVNQRYHVGPQDRLLFVTSASFDLSVYDIFGTLAAGGSLYIASHEETHDPALLLDIIYQQKITFWDSAPAFIQQLLPLLPTDDVRENHLRLAFFSGDWIPLTLADRLKQCFAQIHVVGLGGATEATIWSNWFDIGAIHPDWHSIPYGLPIHNARYYVLDRNLNPLPMGVAGDLYIGGECLADGYYQRPALTAERFIPDPFSEQPGHRLYCTGDRAKRMADGQLEFIGRVDDQVKVRGYRIEPGEVQAALLSHPSVEQAAAIVRNDGPGGYYLAAYVIPRPGDALDAEMLRSFLFDLLPEYMVPSSYMVLTAFPLTVNGKLDKAALPKPEELLAGFIAPETETECQISQYFSELTQVESVGIHDNFFSLGGDSLLATQLLVRLRTAFEAQLSMGTIFDMPTVAALARHIDSVCSEPALSAHLLSSDPEMQVSGPHSVFPPKDAPLSFAQMRLWFIHQLQGQSSEYHIPVTLRLHGEIHLTCLIAAVRRVVDTHGILSARIIGTQPVGIQVVGTDASRIETDNLGSFDHVSEGEGRYPRQQTVHPVAFNIPVTDIRQLSDVQKEKKIDQILAQEWEQAFDLSAGPLFRAQIIQVERDTCILALTCHHMISDGWSMNLLKHQIFENYQRILDADNHDIPADRSTARHYFEFAQADHTLECGGRYQQELAYWQQKLAGIPAELSLASDFERPAEPDYHAGVIPCALTAEQVAGLKKVGERLNGVTPYMILLSALSIVLSRFSGESDIVIGSPVANRQSEDWEDVIGLFVSTIALRIQLQPHLRLSDVLQQVKQTCIEAYQYQSVPFERLVDALALERDLTISPVFQVMLAMQNTPKDHLHTDGFTIESIFGKALKTRFDVELHAVPVGQGLELYWLYKKSLFKGERVAAWAQSFNTLINQIIETPDQFIAGSNILPLHDRNRELITFNQTHAPVAVTSLANMFEQQVVRSGGAIAVQGQSMGSLSAQIQLTYGQLNTRANQLAHYLLAQGIEPGMRIGLCLDRTIELIISMLAVVKIGAAYVPLDSEWPAERLDLILEDTAASLVLTQHRYVAQISKADCLCWEDLNLANQPAHNPAIHVPAEFLAYIIFTSGSTGMPKGVAMQHGPACHLIHWVNERYQVSADDHLLFVTSPCFDLSVYDVFGILAAGARLTIVPKDQLKDPHGLVQMIDKYQITFWDSAPAFMQQLTPVLAEMSTSDFQNNLKMRLAFFSGDWIPLTLPGALKQAYPNIQVVGLGGATEAAIWSNWFDITEVQPQWSSIPYGLPITNAQYYILDAMKQPVPSGVTGDLYIAGECLASGYYNRPGLTAERFIPNPFAQAPGGRLYNTGDRARRLPDGNIEFMGRLDQQVKVRGFRIELGEIQAALLAHPDVAQAFVTVRCDGPSGNYLLAYIVSATSLGCEGDGPDTEALKTYLAASLPDYMIPAAFISLDAFPLTVNGKLDVKALPLPTRQGQVFTAPRTQEESILCRLFAEVLSIDQVGVDDNFFALGGDSIVTIMLVQKARQMNLAIDIKAIFQQQTPAKIAAVVQPMLLEPEGSEVTDQAFDNTMLATPVMQWMFERHAQFNSFSQTVLLHLPDVVDRGQFMERIQSLLQWLVNKHDMLRLIIRRDKSHDERRWVFDVQSPGQVQSADFITQYDLSMGEESLGEEDAFYAMRDKQLSTIAMKNIQSLNPASGQMIRATVLYEEKDAAEHASLLLSIHHLSVDGVSWHLLCEDLKSGWERLDQGRSLAEEAQSATQQGSSAQQHRLAFAQWGHVLLEDAYSPLVKRHLPYWQTLASNSHRCPPVFTSESVAAEGRALTSARHLRVEMSESVAKLLLALPASFHGRLEDVLVLALTVTVNQWQHACQQPVGPVLLDMESHGRYCNPQDPSSPQQARARVEHDLLNTVGWFTAIYPALIDIDDFNLSDMLRDDYEMARALKAVKEQLRQIPALINDEGEISQEGRGMSYGLLRYLNRDIDPSTLTPRDAEIAFNYLGHIRSDSDRPWSLDLTAAASLQVPDEDICLIHPLSVNTVMQTHNGKTTLVSDWIWADSHVSFATIQTLASHWQVMLETLASHYQTSKAVGNLKKMGSYTPSDFPLTCLTEPQVERLERCYPTLETILPLSPLQEGLLFHANYDQHTTDLYTVQLGVEVTGSLNVGRLKQSFEQLLMRHPVLRSAFFQEEVSCQVITQQKEMPWIEADVSHLPRAEAEQQAALLRQTEKNKRFDLACSPLMRVLMVKMPDTASEIPSSAYQLVISHHHILMDGWSMAIFIKELFYFYDAANDAHRLPAVQPYARYLSWINQQNKESLIHWWQEYLKDFSEPCRLAGVAHEEATHDEAAARWPERLEKTLSLSVTQQLNDIARSLNITLNSVLQGVWGLMMAKYTDKNDIVFGVTVSGRPPEVPGVEQMVGLFISTLPLRVRYDPRQSLQAFLCAIQENHVLLAEHQHIGLSEVQEAAGGGELFDTLIVLENYPLDQAMLHEPAPGLKVGQIFPDDATHYPVSLIITPGEQLHLRLQYNQALFSAEKASSVLNAFTTLLAEAVLAPEQPMGQLSIIRPEEKRQEIEVYNQTATDFVATNLVALFEKQLLNHHDDIALTGRYWGEQTLCSLTYHALNQHANQVAHFLISQGVKPGDHVGICMTRSLDLVIAILGVLKTGAAYVPIDPDMPEARMAFIIEDTGAVVVFALHHIEADFPDTQLVQWKLSRFSRFAQTSPCVQIDASYPVYIIFTSGSTGTPKGVALQHGPVTNLIDWVNNHYQIGEHDRLLYVTSPSFDLSVYDVFGILAAGGRVYVASPEEVAEPSELIEVIYREKITFWDSAPAFMQQLLPLLPTDSQRESALRLVFLGGDWIPLTLSKRLQQTFPHVHVVSIGGATEVAIFSNWFDIGEIDPVWKSIPYGLPIQNARYYILDQYLNPVPFGMDGDLYIGGEGLAYSYYNRPQLTAERFIPDPFIPQGDKQQGKRMYKTGDRARRLADGNIEFLGRVDYQVKLRGYRIEIGEIQAVLAAYPKVEKAVMTISECEGGKQLLAYVSTAKTSNHESSDDHRLQTECYDHLRGRLPKYMLPSAITVVKDWPLTANGKVDLAALPKPQLRSQSYCAPRTHQEHQLCQSFAEVLPVKQIGIDDNFFELGGHSILAAQLISKIEIATGVKMTIRALFEMPTVRGLAASLVSGGAPCSSVLDPIFPIRENGQMQPLFCIHPVIGLSWCYSGLISSMHHHRPIYGIQAELTGDAVVPSSIEAMAREYVALIQQVQPTGPYHLLGWSFGGYIAQAIACQLQAAQEDVGLLALMDSYPMSENDALPVWDEQAVLQGFATAMEIDLGDIQPDTLTMKLFIHAARKAGHLLGHLDNETGARLMTLMQAYRQMVPEFRPQTFAGDMLFFAATEDEEIMIQWEEPVSSANWQPYVTGQIETRLMRCAHTEMSNPEHLREIGLRIERYLSGRSAKNEVMDG